MIETIKKSLLAGLMISCGGTVFLSCENRVVGAFLFTVGLLTICILELSLFTGKIGYVLDNKNALTCGVIWLGNVVSCTVCALLLRFAQPALSEKARPLFEAKTAQPFYKSLILGFFCGVLMYIAVEIFRTGHHFGKYLGILTGIPTFILCGFEHSIADVFYCALGANTLKEAVSALIFVIIVSVGNAAGSIAFRLLFKKEVR